MDNMKMGSDERIGVKTRDLLVERDCDCRGYLQLNSFFQNRENGFFFLEIISQKVVL